MSLNNNQVATILNTAIAMSTGAAEIGQLNLQQIVDTGNDDSVIGSVEKFTKSLLNVVIKNWFTDSSYRSSYKDPFLVMEEEYGAIIQNISIEVPDVIPSHAWQDFVSAYQTPVGETPTTVGTYLLYIPKVHSYCWGHDVSFELPVTISDEQWDTAFRSAAELAAFVNYIFMCVDNKLVQHMENLNNMNRNNFIAEKIAYSQSDDAVGVHVVNLVEEYAKSIGKADESMTAEAYLNDKLGLLYGSEKIRLFKDYMGKMTKLFNIPQRDRFVPDDRLVIQVVGVFAEALNTVALSDTYHKDIVELPNYQTVPYWQGSGEGFTWDEVTNINVKTGSDGTAVDATGIVALMADKWGILHTVKSTRVAQKYFEPEALRNVYYQHRDSYMNDLSMSAVVFVVQDYTAPAAA